MAMIRNMTKVERDPEHSQAEIENVEQMRELEKRMEEYPQIHSPKEAKLLLGKENLYGIYQITDEGPGREYQFMNFNFIEKHGYQVRKEDYTLVYSDELAYGETLDSLYEKFNTAHPADYTGHSLSVSDIVVLNDNGNLKAYFVDSLSFRELPNFLHLESGRDLPQKSEQFPDGKTEQMKTTGEYKPLAKVEELEEANYNMIDNVFNNMTPKKASYLEYYAAECDEFHDMGNFYKSKDLQEILTKYQEIVDDPSLGYYGNGMGIIYRDLDDAHYDGTEISIISGKSIHGEHLDQVAYLAAVPIMDEVLLQIVETFPDFRYYPRQEVKGHLYPENMTADELAAILNELAETFDFYDYQDNFNPGEDLVEMVALELRCGNAYKYIPYLKDIIDEECGQSSMAEELLEKMKAYQPEVPEGIVPVVRVNFCEDKEMDTSGYQKLADLDKKISDMDKALAAKIDEKTGLPEKTVQMYFTIYYPDDNRMKELKGKINIGDGNGGIVKHLKMQNEIKLCDESWLNYQKSKGEETFQAYIADLTDMQEHVLPHLQSFCSLEEKGPERLVEAITASKTEMETEETIAAVGNGRTKTVETVKNSIHERLKINKEIIARQQGKDNKEKGVELAANKKLANIK